MYIAHSILRQKDVIQSHSKTQELETRNKSLYATMFGIDNLEFPQLSSPGILMSLHNV